MAGKDGSKQFWKYHNEGVLHKYQPSLLVGSLDSKPRPEPELEPAAGASAVAAAEKEVSSSDDDGPLEPFGPQIPFADPSWYQGVSLGPPFGCLFVQTL